MDSVGEGEGGKICKNKYKSEQGPEFNSIQKKKGETERETETGGKPE